MELKKVRAYFSSPLFNQLSQTLYGSGQTDYQRTRYLNALDEFQRYFNLEEDCDMAVYSAPGRAEVSGNHTDHQFGKVLAAAIGFDTVGFVVKSQGQAVIKSQGYDEIKMDIDNLAMRETEKDTSLSLVKGIMYRLSCLGYSVGGFQAYIISDVLPGSGLSSSAAYESLIGGIISHAFNDGSIPPVEIAKAGQYAENNYFGKPCGLMDQLASSVGGFVYIDFAQPENPVIEEVTLDTQQYGYSFYVVDTGGSHHDLTDDYAAIPKEMKEVAAFFGKNVLNDVAEDDFYRNLKEIRESTSDRAILRAMHFFSENQRVAAQAALLKSGEFAQFLNRVTESGHSSYCLLQNIYAPSDPQDQGLSIALSLSRQILGDNGAYRVHGGGFAGSILAIVPNPMEESYVTGMDRVFGKGASKKLHVRPKGVISVL